MLSIRNQKQGLMKVTKWYSENAVLIHVKEKTPKGYWTIATPLLILIGIEIVVGLILYLK